MFLFTSLQYGPIQKTQWIPVSPIEASKPQQEKMNKLSYVMIPSLALFFWKKTLHWKKWLPENLHFFSHFALGSNGRASSEMWEGTEMSLESWHIPTRTRNQLKLTCSLQAHLGPIPESSNCTCTSLSACKACLTSNKSVPHAAWWVTWNSRHIPTCRQEIKQGDKGLLRTEHDRSACWGLSRTTREEWISRDAGTPQPTENSHSKSSLAGPCLELRESWRMVRVLAQPKDIKLQADYV